MTTKSRKKKRDLLKNCLQFALKLFWNACIWIELADLILYVQWTSLPVPSWCGREHATNVQHVWFLTFVTQVNSNSVVKWEIQHNNVGWDCFRTLTLLETSESTSGGILCNFGSHTFVRASWMCEKQTSVSNCSTEAEFIALDAGLRMDGIPALTLWALVMKYFIPYRTEQMDPRESHGETRWQLSSRTCITPSQQHQFQQTSITFHQKQGLLFPVLCCMSLRTIWAVITMII